MRKVFRWLGHCLIDFWQDFRYIILALVIMVLLMKWFGGLIIDNWTKFDIVNEILNLNRAYFTQDMMGNYNIMAVHSFVIGGAFFTGYLLFCYLLSVALFRWLGIGGYILCIVISFFRGFNQGTTPKGLK